MATMVKNPKKPVEQKRTVTKEQLKEKLDKLASKLGKAKVEEGARGTKVVMVGKDRFRAPASAPVKVGETYEVVEQAKGHVVLKSGDRKVAFHKANVPKKS